MVMRQGLRLSAIGFALGLAGTLALTRVLASFLFDMQPWDPPTLLGGAVILVLVCAASKPSSEEAGRFRVRLTRSNLTTSSGVRAARFAPPQMRRRDNAAHAHQTTNIPGDPGGGSPFEDLRVRIGLSSECRVRFPRS
jgi:hypothetical protein